MPKGPNDNTLGFTTKGRDLDKWRAEAMDGPIEFDIDMGPLANKGHFFKRQDGYWLQLAFSMVGYFVIDGDGRFDDYRFTTTPPGDEPCHVWDFKLFDLYVNDQLVHTAMGSKERPCDTETNRFFDIVPMKIGEPANQFRVETWIVKPGRNDIRIELHDTGFLHPQSNKRTDGWHMYVAAAMMELVAPPMFISHGWNADLPPGGHQVGVSQWQKDAGTNLQQKSIDHFGQNAWSWAKPAGVWLFGFDGKQDIRLTAKQFKQGVWDVANRVGYCYSCDPDLQGFYYIGFSMGGLIGRQLVQNEGMLKHLGKYVSVGTPHEGSRWADMYTFTLDKVNAPYRDINGDRIRNWFGWDPWWQNNVQARVYENNWYEWLALPPHWEGNGALLDHRADFEIRRGDNPVKDGLNAGVGVMVDKSFAVAGNGGNAVRDIGALVGSRLHPALALVGLLPDGDLIVSTGSATLGGTFESETCFAVHIEGVPGIPLYFYNEDCMMPIFEFLTGFRDPGKISDPPGPGHSSIDDEPVEPGQGGSGGEPGLGVQEEGQAGAANLPADTLLVPFGEAASHEVELDVDPATGQGSVEVEVRVEATPTALFQVFWASDPSFAELRLVTPDGVEITALDADDHGATFDARFYHGLAKTQIAVGDPAPGLWTVRLLTTEDTPEWGLSAVVVAGMVGTLALEAEAPIRVDPGTAAVLTARLTAPVDDGSVTITGTALPTETELTFVDDGTGADAVAGDGLYTASYDVGDDPEHEGSHVIDVTAEGRLRGVEFVRTDRVTLLSYGQVDLEVRGFSVAPLEVWWGDTVEATALVANTGTGTATGVQAVWSDTGDLARRPALTDVSDVGSIAPGEEVEVRFTWMPTPGTQELHVQFVADGIEEDLSDNTAFARTEVLATPRTQATLWGPEGQEGWFVGPVRIELAPFDGSPAPYAATHYRISQGPWTLYTAPFRYEGDGDHTLTYRSTDVHGNVEAERTATFRLDTTAPVVAVARPVENALHTLDQVVPMEQLTMPTVLGLVDVHLPNADATSGVARVEVRIEGILIATLESPDEGLVWRWDSTTTSMGRHTLDVRVVDAAGWTAETSQEVYVAVSRAVQVDHSSDDTLERIHPPVQGV